MRFRGLLQQPEEFDSGWVGSMPRRRGTRRRRRRPHEMSSPSLWTLDAGEVQKTTYTRIYFGIEDDFKEKVGLL